jgi:hypothetical protein
MTDTATTAVDVFQAELDPATARVFAAQWREAQRLAMTSVIPKTITHRRERKGSDWVDVAQPIEVVRATVFAVVRYGAEVFGYPGPTALARIDVIEGRLEPRYDALLGLMLDAGHQVRTREMSDQRATIAVRRREDIGDPEGWQTFSFTLAEATAAGYIKERPSERDLRGAWYTRRADLLMSKAVRRAFRLAGSDSLMQDTPLELVDGAQVEQIVGDARSAGLPVPEAAAPFTDDVVDAEIVDDEESSGGDAGDREAPGQADSTGPGTTSPPDTTDEDQVEHRAKLQRQLMATATKAFPKDTSLLPAQQRARVTAQRHAVAFVALGEHKSASDMTEQELGKVLARLDDVQQGRLRIEDRDGVWWAVQGDRELPIPAEDEPAS